MMLITAQVGAEAAPDRTPKVRAAMEKAIEHHDSVELGYHGSTRTVVPIKLQGTGECARLLCRRADSQELRAYRLKEVESAEVNPRQADPAEVVAVLKSAAAHDHCVELRYRTDKDYLMEVTVEPHGLKWSSGSRLLLEAVRTDNGLFRTFRVDRVEEAQETNRAFDPTREVVIEGYSLKGPDTNAPVVLASMD